VRRPRFASKAHASDANLLAQILQIFKIVKLAHLPATSGERKTRGSSMARSMRCRFSGSSISSTLARRWTILRRAPTLTADTE
jgi:hypothetical protein